MLKSHLKNVCTPVRYLWIHNLTYVPDWKMRSRIVLWCGRFSGGTSRRLETFQVPSLYCDNRQFVQATSSVSPLFLFLIPPIGCFYIIEWSHILVFECVGDTVREDTLLFFFDVACGVICARLFSFFFSSLIVFLFQAYLSTKASGVWPGN